MSKCFELLKVNDCPALFNNLCTDIVDKELTIPAIKTASCCETCGQTMPQHYETERTKRTLELRDARLDVITKIVCDYPFYLASPGGGYGGCCKIESSVERDGLHVVDFKRGLPLDPRPYFFTFAGVRLPRNQACHFVVSGAVYDDDSLDLLKEITASSQNVFVELSWTLAVISDCDWLSVLFLRNEQSREHWFPPGWPGYEVSVDDPTGERGRETWKDVFADQTTNQTHQTGGVDDTSVAPTNQTHQTGCVVS